MLERKFLSQFFLLTWLMAGASWAGGLELSAHYLQDKQSGEYLKLELTNLRGASGQGQALIFGEQDFSQLQWTDNQQGPVLALTLKLEDFEQFPFLPEARLNQHPITSGQLWGASSPLSSGAELFIDPKERVLALLLTAQEVGLRTMGHYHLGQSYPVLLGQRPIGRVIKIKNARGQYFLYWEVAHDQLMKKLTEVIIIP